MMPELKSHAFHVPIEKHDAEPSAALNNASVKLDTERKESYEKK